MSDGSVRQIGSLGLVALISVFVVLGAPLVYLVWRFINELLLGVVDGSSALLAAVGLVLLSGLMVLVARQIHRWEGK